MRVLERVQVDRANGRLWKARQRLDGALHTYGANQLLLENLGRRVLGDA